MAMRAVAILVALGVLAVTAHVAAGALVTREHAPVRPSLRVPSDPLFTLRGLQPGDRSSRCVSVEARDAGRLSLFTGGENGALAPHLHVRLLRGCNGDEVLFEGRLDELPLEPDAIPAGGDIRVDVEVLPTAPQAARATKTFAVGAEAGSTARAASRCKGLTRRSVRLGRVVATVSARTDGRRLRLKTALRIGGKTLRQRWATVAYRIDSRGWRTTRRPFRLTLARPPGAARVLVRIRPSRHRSATVRLPLLCEVRP
jgi:hypothetical protein